MPRRVTSRVHDYFIFNNEASICQLPNKEGKICNTPIKGKHAGNLEKHVKTWHNDEWNSYWTDKTLSLSISESEEPSTSFATHFVNVDFSYVEPEEFVYPSQSTPLPQKRKENTDDSLEHPLAKKSCLDLEDALVELVTVNGAPFSIVEESGFKKLMNVVDQMKNSTTNITPNKLQKLVKTKADSIRTVMNEMVQNKLLCLRIDCAIVEKKHYFGISVHFRNANRLEALNLAVISLPHDHTQDTLKEDILNVLQEFVIGIDQIYYILVTNCSQALKVSSKPDDMLYDRNPIDVLFDRKPSVTSVEPKSEPHEYNGYDSDFDIFEVEETELDNDEEEKHEIRCDEEVTNDETTEKLVEEVINYWSKEQNIIVGKSLTYAFQMAVLDTLDAVEAVRILLKKIRNIVKKLRSPVYTNQLKSLRCKRNPILDSKSRLLSSYDMLQRFMELKPYLDQLSATATELSISLKEWNLLMDVVDSLKPLKTISSRLSSKDLPLSEFYKIWITCFLKTKKIGTPFSSRLCKSMDRRKSWLFSNIAFKACLYLDPRFKNTISVQDYKEISEHLINLYDRITNYQPAFLMEEECDSTTALCSVKVEQVDDDDDELYNYVQSMVKTPVKQCKANPNIRFALQAFADSESVLEVQNVPEFWQEKKYLYGEVYQLSQVILSIPSFNAFLDQFVSQLRFILWGPKSGIESRSLRDIILVRNNFNLLNNSTARD